MSSTAPDAAGHGIAARLGIGPGDLVQQLGEDEDVDPGLVPAVLAVTGTELVPADSDDVVDAVLMWYRDGDGDLVDALVDARRQLSDAGAIWLLTPKAGRSGHVEPADVREAVPTAGLAQTSTVTVGPDWTASKLAAPRGQRSPRR